MTDKETTAATPAAAKHILLNRHSLGVVAAASKDNTRYSLRNIRVTPSFAEATDRHRLIRVTAPNLDSTHFPVVEGFGGGSAPLQEAQIPAETVAQIVKLLPKKASIPALGCAAVAVGIDNLPHIAVTDLETRTIFKCATNGDASRFPNTEAVLPKDTPVASIKIQTEYLLSLAKAAKDFTAGQYQPGVILDFYGSDKAMRLRAHNDETGQDWTAIVMPLRLDK